MKRKSDELIGDIIVLDSVWAKTDTDYGKEYDGV